MPLKDIIKGIKVNLLFKEGDRMKVSEKIIQTAKENNGIVTTAVLSEKGILRGNLKNLLMKADLKKLREGCIFCRKYGKMNF